MLFTANDLIYTGQPFGEIVGDRSRSYGLANALQQTQKKGLQAASIPKLIQARTACDNFTDPLWVDWFFGMSGVYHIGDAFFFSHGNDHPLAQPKRIRRAIRMGLIYGAARLTPAESRYFTQKPVLAYEDFLQKSARQVLPEPYTIRADASLFRGLKNDSLILKDWRNDPRAIIYAGGKNAAKQYAERLRQYGQTKAYLRLDYTEKDLPDWGRVLFLGYGNSGLGGGSLNDVGRFVGVAPEAQPVAKKSLEHKVRSA